MITLTKRFDPLLTSPIAVSIFVFCMTQIHRIAGAGRELSR